MTTQEWDAKTASRYDDSVGPEFEPDVIRATVDVLADLAAGGRALELAVGTGRIALPLSARGVPVSGIELSTPMATRLGEKDTDGLVEVSLGDMTTTRASGVRPSRWSTWRPATPSPSWTTCRPVRSARPASARNRATRGCW